MKRPSRKRAPAQRPAQNSAAPTSPKPSTTPPKRGFSFRFNTRRQSGEPAGDSQGKTRANSVETTASPTPAGKDTKTDGAAKPRSSAFRKPTIPTASAGKKRPVPTSLSTESAEAVRQTQQAASQSLRELLGRRVGAGKNHSGMPLGIVSLILIVALATLIQPLYNAAVQYDQYRTLQSQLQRVKQENEALTRELANWKDEDFIQIQARERLGFARAGEIQYLVIDPGPEYADQLASSGLPQGPKPPWFVQLIGSVQDADRAVELPKEVDSTDPPPSEDKENNE